LARHQHHGRPTDVGAADRLNAPNIAEDEISVIGLNGKSNNHAIVGLFEVTNLNRGCQRVRIDRWSTGDGAARTIEIHLGRLVQEFDPIHPFKLSVFRLRRKGITKAICGRHAIPRADAVKGLARAGNIQQGFFLKRIAGNAIFAGAGRIHKLDLHI